MGTNSIFLYFIIHIDRLYIHTSIFLSFDPVKGEGGYRVHFKQQVQNQLIDERDFLICLKKRVQSEIAIYCNQLCRSSYSTNFSPLSYSRYKEQQLKRAKMSKNRLSLRSFLPCVLLCALERPPD
jgi:hypothetical protein